MRIKSFSIGFISLIFLLFFIFPACGGSPSAESEDLGGVYADKADVTEISNKAITIKAATASSPGVKTYKVTADVNFDVAVTYDSTSVKTRIVVQNTTKNTSVQSELTVNPILLVSAADGICQYQIKIENHSTSALSARLSVTGNKITSPADVVAAAKANLQKVKMSVDYNHLKNYGLQGATEDQFLRAVKLEYESLPAQYQARMIALASMVFFGDPTVLPPQNGKLTPFHGMNVEQYQALRSIEDSVFEELLSQNNGDLAGVRPFSVCETKYIIEKFVKAGIEYTDFESYKAGYQEYAQTCPQADIDEWYNFRGLGGLRPSWVESNVMDRFLRREVKRCVNPTSEFQADCASWNSNRLQYRLMGNRQLASRLFFYEPASQEETFYDTSASLVLMEDRNGDGVGEFLMDGPATTQSGETGTLSIESTGEFTGRLKFTNASGVQRSIRPKELVAQDAVHPNFKKEYLDQPDFGLMTMFPDPTGCWDQTAEPQLDQPDPENCPLIKRFYVMIDRHEDFYQTFSALNPDNSGISSQPSPLVACSVTLDAAHGWAFAGMPPNGTNGFVYLMRIPYREVLTGSDKSISTLQPGPDTLSLQDLYRGERVLDFSKVWLDIASLSNNAYSSEHEISKFGAVPAEQIEGILVIPSGS